MQISNPFISIFFNLSVKFYYLPFLKKSHGTYVYPSTRSSVFILTHLPINSVLWYHSESMETYTIPENEAIDILFHIYIRRNVRDIISVDLIDRNSGELIS